MKQKILRLISSLLAAVMLLTAVGYGASFATAETETAAVRLQDDFYQAVNGQWIEAAVIPASESSTGGFTDLSTEITDMLMADFDTILQDNPSDLSKEMQDFLAFYELVADYQHRNEQGVQPVLADLESIEGLSSLDDFNNQLSDFVLNGFPLPFSFGVMADMSNADYNVLYASSPSLFLLDKSYYGEGNPTGEMLSQVTAQMFQTMLMMAGKSAEEAAAIAQQALDFDQLLARYSKSAEESSNFTAMYNPQPMADFTGQSTHLNLTDLITQLTGTTPEEVIVTNPDHFSALDKIVNPDQLENLKSWMYVSLLSSASSVLSEEIEEAGSMVMMMMSGQTELSPAQKRAYYLASNLYSPVVGIYYGEKYFGQEAKEDVITMVNNFVDVYKDRLEKTDWLTEGTRNSAVLKLDNMSIQIGYPDSIPEIYSQISIDREKSCYDNLKEITRVALKDNYAKLGKPVDRDEWGIGGHVVNAFYSPMTNTITFPAGILQAPFYSIEQTPSQNYGGIGAVIAHEISHAFDPNGAMFDEKGNLKNWWTEQDYAEFEKRTNAVLEQFDGIEFAGGAVNGTLTVTENTADAGGLSVALEVVESLDDENLEEFFTNWAVIWRTKSTPEYEQLLLTLDTHAPSKLRANMQLSNLDAFYTTFDVQDGDGMYIAPEERIKVW